MMMYILKLTLIDLGLMLRYNSNLLQLRLTSIILALRRHFINSLLYMLEHRLIKFISHLALFDAVEKHGVSVDLCFQRA